MDRARMNLAALVLALSACWGIYLASQMAMAPAAGVVVPDPAAAAVASACAGPGTQGAGTKAGSARGRHTAQARKQGRKPQNAGRGTRACVPQPVPVAELTGWAAPEVRFMLGTSTLMMLLALLVRVIQTRLWLVRVMSALLVVQLGGFLMQFVVKLLSLQNDDFWMPVQITPAVEAGLGLVLQVWCLRVFGEYEDVRERPFRTFEGPHLVEQVEEMEKAKAKALMDGNSGVTDEMPTWLQQAEEDPVAAEPVASAGAEPETEETSAVPATVPGAEYDGAFLSGAARDGPVEQPSYVQVRDDTPGADHAPASAAGQHDAHGRNDTLLAMSVALGSELCGGWIECASQQVVYLYVVGSPGEGVELLLADSSGTWMGVPAFDAATGSGAATLPAGQWYVAARDNLGRNAPVTIMVVRAGQLAA